ncbi:MAG: multidrug ABC transporter substrate-binding protein [Phycisphaerae bacterium]|nr:MAG: ABC transporter permease [Planctomycetia bacterium]RIK66368.1 MAG: multidrug ABC transporter substrate-binding protein [Planctomycetota bacterium]GJQ25125.1 MAG: multidrug ABC transporter substrate-binding protein [Phycisphaerae bacterium]
MFFFRIVMMALRSLWIHPLRSILATLGVIIGVAAVVAAMAILKGMGARMESGFASMGSNKIFVGAAVQRRSGRMVGTFDSIKYEDALAIDKECGAVGMVMPQVTSSSTIKFLSKNTTASVLGASEIYPDINNHKVSEGSFFTRTDVQGGAAVVVLGSKVKKELFGGRPAIDEKVKISGLLGTRTFTVVGVMEEKGNVAFTDVDQQVIVPITAAMEKLYGLKSVHAILAEALSPSDQDIERAKDQIKRVLRQRHKIRAGQQDDFQVQAQREFVTQFAQFQIIAGVVLWSIAGISLVVGGIGIMNIMLVAVTERTREIGVRMAMGAQRGDVLNQFLVEASIVSLLGGAAGVLTGWGLARTIEKITRVMETITTSGAVLMALGMATVVGIISGIYPAWKASRLDPVEALRYE